MQFNTDNILAARDETKVITALDGRVAAYLCHNNKHYVVSSPNQDHIPLPPIGIRQIRLRANLRYGLEDHCQWPQFVVAKFGHLPTIPKRPNNNDDELSILWWDPTTHDFVPSIAGLATGLGQLLPSKLQHLRSLFDSLLTSIADFTMTPPTPTEKAIESFHVLQNRLQNALNRLTSLKASFTETVFNLTEFQRHFLHLDGFLSYMKTYRLRLDGVSPTVHVVDSLIRGFTMNADSVQSMFHAGVPVWFVEEWDGTPLIRNILQVVNFAMPGPNLVMGDHSPPFSDIYNGEMISEQRYSSIYNYAANRLISGDPFFVSAPSASTVPPRSVITSPSTASPSGGHQSLAIQPIMSISSHAQARIVKRDPQAKIVETGRSRFKAIEGSYAPFSISAWSAALEGIHCSPGVIVDPQQTLARYILPDPGIFVGTKNIQRYLSTFLQVRFIALGNVTSEGGALLSQEWRQVLNLDLTQPPPTGSTFTAQSRRKAWEKLQIRPDALNKCVSVASRTSHPPDWEGQTYPPGTEIPADVVRQILWWIYELNFTYELIALDLRLTTALHPDPKRRTSGDIYDRELLTLQCFETGYFKVVPISSVNNGLAADDILARLPFIQNLGKMMKTWPNVPEIITRFCDRRQISSIGSVHGLELEKAIATFYCQSFWNQFGRAPQIPHRLHRLQ